MIILVIHSYFDRSLGYLRLLVKVISCTNFSTSVGNFPPLELVWLELADKIGKLVRISGYH